MRQAAKKNLRIICGAGILALSLNGCLGLDTGKKKAAPDTSGGAEPDKVLFDRAQEDIKANRFTVARLNLQTLINTYPDSEYLAKAKLAIADSYYHEGGTSGLTQSIAEYKDFITFFPFLDEAAYAQMQVAMAHYRMMEKPDRDSSQARDAEDELQTFLLKYPQSPLLPQAEQRLREVQEVLAEGDYRVAHFYYLRATDSSYKAAAARLVGLTDRYPLYSQSDQALWMLGDIYTKKEHREIADQYYARIVRDYPLSPLAAQAKQKLVADGLPVPQADPNAMARMQAEQRVSHPRHALLKSPLALLKTAPDVSHAAHKGPPNLNPPGEAIAANDILKPGSTGQVGDVGSGGGGTGVAVETVPAGSAPPSAPGATNPPLTEAQPPAGANPAPGGAAVTPPADGNSTDPNQPAAASQPTGASSSKNSKADKKKESSSKKKKGLRKIVPW